MIPRYNGVPGGGGGGSGDVAGPAASTDNALVRYDGTTGKLLQDGVVTESDAGALSGATQVNVDNLRLDGNALTSTDANGVVQLLPNGTGAVQLTTKAASGQVATIGGTGGNDPGLYLYRTVGADYARSMYRLDVNDATDGGMGRIGSGSVEITTSHSGAPSVVLASQVVSLGSGSSVVGSSSSDASVSSPDTGMKRDSAGTWIDTNGSSGVGARLSSRVVEANTAGSGSPNLLLATESRKLLTNQGATAENYHTLPSAAAGYEFVFYCQDTDGLRVVASAGDTIRLSASVSVAAGFVRSGTAGSCVTLVAINATEWIATAIVGTWTVDI